MYKPLDEKQRRLHRLKIVRGHIDRVIRMIAEEEYCVNILHQSHAIQKALKELDFLILENHLKTCATDEMKKGRPEKAIKEIMEVYKKGYS